MRLTEKCWRNLDPWECCGQDKYCQRGCHDEGGCTNGCKVPKIYCKLAKYEDLEEQCIEENQCGLRELLLKWKEFFDDIAELYDYRTAEKQGLFLRLPCKVGDKIYCIYEKCDFPGDCYTTRKCRGCEYRLLFIEEVEFCISMLCQDGALRHPYYTSREEAESALAEKGE